MKNIWFLAGAVLIVCLFASNVHRAATQAITHDEAATYNWFLAGPMSLMFGHYNANHHVLHTFLCKASVTLFGISELSMRLPSLLGGGLYLSVCLLFSRYLFGDGWLSLLTTSFLTLNPLVLDFLSLARGYGLGLGLWIFAMFRLTRYLSDGRKAVDLYWAAAGTGLSMAANLVFVFPCLATMASLLLAVRSIRSEAPVAKKKKPRSVPPPPGIGAVIVRYCLPSVVLTWFIISRPIAQATPGSFYVGAASLWQSGMSLAESSYGVSGRLAASVAAVTILVATVAGAWKIGRSDATRFHCGFILAAASVPPLFGLLLLAHFGFGLPYPEGRTGLYLIPLIGLLAAMLVKYAGARRALAIPSAIFLGLSVLRFATLFPAGPYDTWRYDSGTRDAVAAIAKDYSAHPRPVVRIGATWQLEPSLNFYRQMFHHKWMAPVTRSSPTAAHDYYYLLGHDRAIVQSHRLRTLLTDSRANTVLAATPGI